MATKFFEERVIPAVTKLAVKVFGMDDELISMSIVLAWWVWRNRKTDATPSVYARLGVRLAKYGRDIPGVQSSHSPDAYNLEKITWQGAGMNGLADHRPTPDEEVATREQVEIFLTLISERDVLMGEYFDLGMSNGEVATALGVSPGRISQRRKECYELFRSLD